MNRWYIFTTLAIAIALAVWFTVPQGQDTAPGQLHAADQEAEPAQESAPAQGGHSLPAIIALAAVLAVSVGFVIVLARLQQRRRKAFKEAAKLQKEEARAAAMARKARDQDIAGNPQ